uniref:RNA polymerase II associated protein 1 n=1 Tax=Sphaeramia orbicularis TaxID=375764 RepID=A0A673CAH8_9TELE
GMLRRPKPTDSEADLLREQEQFLTSGAQSAASVIRRPDKRRGEAEAAGEGEAAGDGQNTENGQTQRDVVSMEDLPDQLPSLTPAPPKKSRFKANRVKFEDEDAAERLDRHDTHISAVLSRIVERDTSSVPISLPVFTGLAFPQVHHRSEASTQVKSYVFIPLTVFIFSRVQKTPLFCLYAFKFFLVNEDYRVSGSRLVSGQGLGGPDSTGETMKIHRENEEKLRAMSQSEILEEQKKLLSQLAQSVPSSASPSKHPQGQSSKESFPHDNVSRQSEPSGAAGVFQKHQDEVMKEEEEEEDLSSPPAMTEKDLPVKPQKEWVHMDKVEPEKLEWMRDLPAPRRKATKMAMEARFDFAGMLIPPTEDLPTHLGLHHHGQEPERAGYSLQELFLLSRSQVIQQRSLALSTLANILAKAHNGEYQSALKGNVMSTLLDAGLIFLLRFALDDSIEGVMSAAMHALNTLLVCTEDEACLDSTFSWFRGMASFPLLPCAQEEEDEEDEGLGEIMKMTVKEKEERKSDHDVARQDVIKGLLKMKLLPRLRYILEVVRPSPRVVQDILEVLTRIARHSSSSATQVLDCPRLLEVIMTEFLPTSWTAPASPLPHSVYGLPLAGAMKLLRVLSTSGRHACARLLNSVGARERLSRLLSVDPSELLLEPTEALRITTEAYRLWAVAAGYGQACQLYIDLYPALVKELQSVHRVLAPSHPLVPLQLQRVLALLSLLTQVTHTAGCHQELQAGAFYSTRSTSVVCNIQSSPETTPSLPGLACPGWRDRLGLAAPCSPFPLLTGLGLLLETITGIHKGLRLLLSEPVIGYLRSCSQATPTLSHTRAWLLQHEHHLLYLLRHCFTSEETQLQTALSSSSSSFSFPQVPIEPDVVKHASLYHQSALVLLPWLLPGSEYLAHELSCFCSSFSEGHSGGPEAVELGELKLHEDSHHRASPSLQTVGALLREACVQLPSIRGCFLTHLAHLESSVLVSRDSLLSRNPWIKSHLLPELTGPTLPSDWPYLPLVSLYERTGVSDGGGLAVEELPVGALQAVTHCLQWLLLLEVWREEALKVVLPVAKFARLSCVFLCSSDLFLERPVQRLTWGLFRLLDSLDLNAPPPGLASFQDLYSALLAQYEAVSFGDRLFGCWVLLPLQRRYSAAMRLAVFGEHVGMLRSLGVTLQQLSIPIERFTSPPEDSLPLLRLYFRSLVTGSLKRHWCPVLYIVALSHVNAFIFSQDAAAQEVEAARHSMLWKIYYLTDEVLLFLLNFAFTFVSPSVSTLMFYVH